MSTPELPSSKRLESESSPPPSPVKDIFERLSQNESIKICQHLSDEETMPATDPVIVTEYRHDTLLALRDHCADGAVLPAFLLGVVSATSDELALHITTAVANGQGEVISPRLISGLKAGEAMHVVTNVAIMVHATLATNILASGGGNLVDVHHMVSHTCMPPNDIELTTITH